MAKSTAEAELLASSPASDDLTWCVDFYKNLFKIYGPSILYSNNQAALAIAEQQSGSGKTRALANH
jgi:hypothetical protein